MTKILNFALKIKGVVGRVAHAKSSDPATPQNLERAPGNVFERANFPPPGTGKVQNPDPWGRKIVLKPHPWGNYFQKSSKKNHNT